ncbi:MAG TPA: PQQ-binding-like beta-propeller repeat protein [Phycisphaerae bacterium]|nr:PQQ-binding-like beta-propeller repeat protein [Phycisphaerae bacterium]
MINRVAWSVLLACLTAGVVVPAAADDWPTYRHDAARSGISADALSTPMSEAWVFTPTHPPSPAWTDPQPKPVEEVLELPRLRFDDAFHVAAAGGMIFFGSSADNTVYALDAATGQVRWTFTTDGPVRMAPTVVGGRLYVGSDDGNVYCLGATHGQIVWRFAAAPAARKVLGNGRMISLWPVRTGVVVDRGVAYFGAGVFPSEGLFLYAVRADDGQLLWKNDSYGQGGLAGISPQGYMLASKGKLFVPSGRSMPAAFDRTDGRFLFHRNFNWRGTGLFGGTYSVLAGRLLFNGTEQIAAVYEGSGRLALNEGIKAETPTEGTRRLVVDADTIYMLTGREAAAVDRKKWTAFNEKRTQLTLRVINLSRQRDQLRKRAKGKDKKLLDQAAAVQKQIDQARADKKALVESPDDWTTWRTACPHNDALALAQGLLLVGGPDTVVGLDSKTGRKVWSGKVDGRARSLAIADGRLIVGTDEGRIHCVVAGRANHRQVAPKVTSQPFPDDETAKTCAALAKDFVKRAGLTGGYALLLGDDGRLALELARRTDLAIYVVDADARRVSAARFALKAAGVYGPRVVVTQTPADGIPFADYFADLVVVRPGFFDGPKPTPAGEVLRMLKPCGGVAFIGRAPEADAAKWTDAFVAGLRAVGEAAAEDAGDWQMVRRGALRGAGSWTHEYAEPGNTACGDDQLVRGELGVLWFGEPGPGRMPSRHSSSVAPLVVGGRAFVQGEEVVLAYDVYNGRPLWQRDMRGAERLGLKGGVSNLAADADSLFVVIGDRCHRLDQATGQTLKTYRAPAARDDKDPTWRYVARVGDLLYGSTRAGRLFAIDVAGGRTRWTHDPGRLMETTICIGSGKVFFVDRAVTEAQRTEGLAGIEAEMRIDRLGKAIPPDVRLAVALDAQTGEVAWQRPQYVADCVKVGSPGGELIAMVSRDVLLLCGQPWNGHFWEEFLAGEFSRRSLIALSAKDGGPLWSGRKGYRSRPLIVGDQVVAEPWAHNLYTGAEVPRQNPFTGADGRWQMARPGHHCGNIAACPNMLFCRSWSTAYYDLAADVGVVHFGAQRPGCWINCIPAAGLVTMPEASSGCVCAFALQCTVTFQPRPTNRTWGTYSADGPATPVQHLAVNFGAPGDRKDSGGTLWLAHPRPFTGRLVADPRLAIRPRKTGKDGVAYVGDNADWFQVAGSDEAWIYAAALSGPAESTIAIPLGKKQAAPRPYTVRLHFAAPATDQAGQRVFNVGLQDKTVLADFDVAAQAGGAGRALVKEFKGVEAGETLTLRLSAKAKELTPATRPLINAVEILAE